MDSMTILSSFCEIPLLNRILLFFYSLCQVTIFFDSIKKGERGGHPPFPPLGRPVSTNAIHCLQGDDN